MIYTINFTQVVDDVMFLLLLYLFFLFLSLFSGVLNVSIMSHISAFVLNIMISKRFNLKTSQRANSYIEAHCCDRMQDWAEECGLAGRGEWCCMRSESVSHSCVVPCCCACVVEHSSG